MILAIDAQLWYAIGAVLAGVGSLLAGLAAMKVARRKGKEDALEAEKPAARRPDGG